MAIQTARRGAVASARRRGGVPATVIPAAGMRGWWKADAITPTPADGSPLNSWTDSSGNNQPFTAAAGPTYRSTGTALPNGRPAVQFGGVEMTSTVDNNTATTKVVVVRVSSYGGGSSVYGGTGGTGIEMGVGPGGKFDVFAGNTIVGRTGTADGAVLPVNTWRIMTVATNGSNSSNTYVNGTLDGPASTAGYTLTATGSVLGSGGGGGFLSGYLAEILDYDRVLDATELAQVHAYLTTKYNIGSTTPPPAAGINLDFDFDDSEDQALSHPQSAFQINSPHQAEWVTNPTRLGTGRAERFEIHNATTDIVNGQAYRAMMDVVNTNDGGDTSGSIVGFNDVYWCWSSYLPSAGDGTVVAGFTQNQLPDYTHLLEIHERGNVNGSTVGINNISEVSNLAIMIRDNQLQFRGRCGTWTWNGTAWTRPAWSTTNPGTSGANDRIPVPIVKPGGTNATMPMNVWVDIIWHIQFSKTSTGLVEVWARQAGQAFSTPPNLTINGPTHKVVVGSDGVTRTSADIETATGLTGGYMHCGIYSGSTSWEDPNNGAHVHVMDEVRRWGTLAEARNNWT